MINIVYYEKIDDYVYKYKLSIDDKSINKIKFEMIETLGKKRMREWTEPKNINYTWPTQTIEEIEYRKTMAQITPNSLINIYSDIPSYEYDLPKSIYIINKLLYCASLSESISLPYKELNDIVKNGSNEVEINFLKEILENIKKTLIDRYEYKNINKICEFFKNYDTFKMEKVITKTLKK